MATTDPTQDYQTNTQTQTQQASPSGSTGSTAPATGSSGMVASQMGGVNPGSGTQMQPAQVNVATRAMDPFSGSVEGRVNSIISKDSALMQRARTQALQQQNRRGLVNSSMAVGAAQAAVIDRALPMAQQDANAYNQAASENTAAANNANTFNAGEANKMKAQESDQTFQAGQGLITRQFQTAERIGTQNFTAAESNAQRTMQERIAQLEQGGMDRRQATDIASQEREASLNRSFNTSERLGTQQFTAGQTVTAQNFQSSQSLLDREQQTRIAQLQETGMSGRQATDIAAQEREANAQRIYGTSERNAQQQFSSSERVSQNTFTAGQQVTAQNFQSSQSLLDREQQTRITQLQEQGMSGRQANDIAAQEREASAQRLYGTSERQAQQAYGTQERLGTQDFQVGQQVTAQNFQSSQALLDRDQQTRIAQLQDSGMDNRQAKEIAAQEREASAQRLYGTSERAAQNTFTAGQSDTRFQEQKYLSQVDQGNKKELLTQEQTWQAGQQVTQQNFQASQTALDRDQQARMQQLQDSGMDSRQAKEIAAQERESAAQRAYGTTENNAQRSFTAAQADARFQENKYMVQVDQGNKKELQTLDNNFQGAQNDANRNTSLTQSREQNQNSVRIAELDQLGLNNRFDKDMALRSSQFNVEQALTDARTAAANTFELQKLGIVNGFNKAQVSSSFAANLSGATLDKINSILADGGLDAAAKSNAINSAVAAANATLSWAETFYGVNVPRLNITAGGSAAVSGSGPSGYSTGTSQASGNSPTYTYQPVAGTTVGTSTFLRDYVK